MFPAFLTTILFSLSAVTGTRTARFFGATEGNFWRLCVAAAALAIYAHTLGQGIAGAGFVILFVSGCIGFGGDIALFQGYMRIGSRLTILLAQCLAAPFAALTEWIWLGNALTLPQILSGLTILAGVGLALAPGKHLEITRKAMIAGVAYGVVAAYCQSLGAVLSRKAYAVIGDAGQSIDGITTAYQRLLGGIVVTGLFLLWVRRREILEHFGAHGESRGRRKEEKAAVWKRGWPWMVVNGLSGPALGVSCYQWALLDKGTGVVMPIVAMTPLVVIPLAMLFEGEKPSRRSIVGGIIAVAGAIALAKVA